jgi:hypothetical protein
MTDTEKQLARFLIILLSAARDAIKTVRSKEFKDLDAKLKEIIDKLKDDADAC